MKTVKLIALDLDGTLVRDDMRISEADIMAVAHAQHAGVPVVIATGRIYQTASGVLSKLHINTPVVCCNGADVRVNGKSVWNTAIPGDCLRKAYMALEPYCSARFVFCGDHIYCEQGNHHKGLFDKWGHDLIKNGLVVYCENTESLLRTVGDRAAKLLACTQSEDRHPEIARELHVFGCFEVVKGERLHFEITRKGTSKADGVAYAARLLGVEMRNVLAIGDSTNDLEMIRSAGIGIAMGNAMPELLQAADGVTLPIHQNGVASAIYRYLRPRTEFVG